MKLLVKCKFIGVENTSATYRHRPKPWSRPGKLWSNKLQFINGQMNRLTCLSQENSQRLP
jgi:hypothetical protein